MASDTVESSYLVSSWIKLHLWALLSFGLVYSDKPCCTEATYFHLLTYGVSSLFPNAQGNVSFQIILNNILGLFLVGLTWAICLNLSPTTIAEKNEYTNYLEVGHMDLYRSWELELVTHWQRMKWPDCSK
jgi:hypothetical protein